MATKKKSSNGESAARLDRPVSATDQAALGATEMEDEDIEDAHNYYNTAKSDINDVRETSPWAGMSAPRTWQQQYRENATDIDIRSGVKAEKAEAVKETK